MILGYYYEWLLFSVLLSHFVLPITTFTKLFWLEVNWPLDRA